MIDEIVDITSHPSATAPLPSSLFVSCDCSSSDGSFAQQLVLGHGIPDLSSNRHGDELDLAAADNQQLLRTLQDSLSTLHQWSPLTPSEDDWSRWRGIIAGESNRLAFLVSKYDDGP